ncbi:DUF222 domain-containing protein [Salinibacterium sp. G-O1]|uniref:HNH endonuclease signature motif containing protein n=1 Tax=Salinibacterium sp. G-O1 TaxID=3046208 RepID=UPI0024B94301|nr:HNH endonuclease signature motif containing protein [Salinibacterium sp. G-O1]MDJ0335323.1 DUF222 domain-containing protein [Salinibacterium sp. G-O1]
MTITTVIVPDHVELSALDDSALLSLQGEIAASRRQLDAVSASISAEVSRRSALELGYAGLAQRSGLRTPEALVQRVAGVTRSEARSMIRVGLALDGSSPWLDPVAAAVRDGSISVASADGIVAGLGVPGSQVAADDLLDAAARLVGVASQTTPERIAAAARSMRDDLDLEGVDDRERVLRDKRFLRLIPQPDGMTRIIGLLDPESAAVVGAAVDSITSPRRGGPRFVDPTEVARAERIIADPRTTEQIALDALVEMVVLAGVADKGKLFGSRKPEVRLHVSLADLTAGSGAAQLEGQTANVSLATAQRLACAGGYVPILFHEGQPLDVGRNERLFTWRQKIALAARDGGCIFPGCDRPPSWCEAHHIEFWGRDDGRTDIEQGVLLCRHHHMLAHNNGWEISLRDSRYWIIPPPSIDPTQTPIPAQSRGLAQTRAHAQVTTSTGAS